MRYINKALLIVAAIAVSSLFAGCGDADSGITVGVASGVAGTGPAARGGTPVGSTAWSTALKSWPKKGNSQIVASDSVVRSSFDQWLDARYPPVMPRDPQVVVLIENLRAFNTPITDLAGDWGVPDTGAAIRPQAIRGIGKTFWADLRYALVEGDQARAMDVIVAMANLPRVAHGFDGSVPRGLIATLATVDSFGWGLTDLLREDGAVEPTAEQCARLRDAASWLDAPEPFGPVGEDENRQRIMKRYVEETRPRLRRQLDELCG
ncbi:MAG: hypothetical protein CMJ27_00325 [Phycisphaerae bacterium]|nr:hypothetical protein [Phycisphaerae bacterium]